MQPRDAARRLAAVHGALDTAVIGQQELKRALLEALLVGGHVLIEGVPGLAKTRAVNALAQACGVDFKRLQFTPDLLPADIVGSQIYSAAKERFETRIGPIFAHFVLADEINRAAPKVQAALLEAMQERQVTIAGETHRLPAPFLVFATQNPVEHEGTYPLPEAQVDRFLFKLVVGYPELDEEQRMVRLVMDETEPPHLAAVLDAATILELQTAARSVFVEDRIVAYAAGLVAATRDPRPHGIELGDLVELGASPRASIALVVAARAHALLDGRESVVPEDVKAVAPRVLRHRLLLSYHAEAEGVRADEIVEMLLGGVPVA
ncbi:MAG: MoxR family ATPase [Acidobacteria bacterium]|nr:MAG: MoxR family ATPase [Acidobacteriota bacterium]REK09141.1 MAG: MoxR family ATPase [Acidobacteriota bacterium]